MYGEILRIVLSRTKANKIIPTKWFFLYRQPCSSCWSDATLCNCCKFAIPFVSLDESNHFRTSSTSCWWSIFWAFSSIIVLRIKSDKHSCISLSLVRVALYKKSNSTFNYCRLCFLGKDIKTIFQKYKVHTGSTQSDIQWRLPSKQAIKFCRREVFISAVSKKHSLA